MNTIEIFTKDEILLQAQKVLNFTAFQNSPILRRFLEYIIDEKINNREIHLKEYSIAVNVLHRLPDFNPHDDAVVRIHAGRLRRAINEYYLIEGMSDPIVIRIPKGCYVPYFESGQTPNVSKPKQPKYAINDFHATVAVFPFRIISESPDVGQFGQILCHQLSSALSKFPEISAIGYFPKEIIFNIRENVLEAARKIDADFLITGSIQHTDPDMRILLCLLSVSSGEILLSKSFNMDFVRESNPEVQDRIVKTMASAVGGYQGIVFQEIIKSNTEKFLGAETVKMAYNSYYLCHRSYSVDNFTDSFRLLSQAVKDVPENPVVWAMLGELYTASVCFGTRIRTLEDPLHEAYSCVMHSLKIDPMCQQAWLTLSHIYLFRGETEACYNASLQCIEINQNSSFIISNVGYVLICAGYFEKGVAILENAVKQSLIYPWWISTGFCFNYLYTGDFEAAQVWADRMDNEETYMDPLLKCVTFAHLGKTDKARNYFENFLKTYQGTAKPLTEMLSAFLLSEELIERIISGLQKLNIQRKDIEFLLKRPSLAKAAV